MRPQRLAGFLVVWFVLGQGAGAGAQDAGPLALEGLAGGPSSREAGGAAARDDPPGPPHEAVPHSAAPGDPEHYGKAPPPPIAERPGAVRPGPDARWIEGYWAWDRHRNDFAWVTGTWLVPPPGEFWVSGYWRRDAKGWYRVPGFWSGGGQVQTVAHVQELPSDGRRAGLPLSPPDEPIGMAPGPDYFYVPGEYTPGLGGVVWRQGFWARSQPGWEWIPARWDRRAAGWVFREGFWNRVSDAPGAPAGNPPVVQGTMLASMPASIGPGPAGMGPAPEVSSNGVTPGNGGVDPSAGSSVPPGRASAPTRPGEPGAAQVASRAEPGQNPAQTSRSNPPAGNTTENGAAPQPGDPRSGPVPMYSQQPAYSYYGAQPMYYPGSAFMWNARSVIGGILGLLP